MLKCFLKADSNCFLISALFIAVSRNELTLNIPHNPLDFFQEFGAIGKYSQIDFAPTVYLLFGRAQFHRQTLNRPSIGEPDIVIYRVQNSGLLSSERSL
jgi:hypothetical protein